MYHDNIYRIDYSFYDILYSINELFMKHNSIKFISRIGNKSYPDTVNQTILYYNNICPLWNKHINLEILNLYEGTKYTIDTSQIEFKKINFYFHRLYKFKNLDDSCKGFYL